MQQVIQSFRKNFQTKPRLFFSPGRINLIGEHIDYNHGYVMPAAIDKGIWFAVAVNHTNTANFVSVDQKESYSVALDAVQKQDSWKNYVLGVLNVLDENDIKIGGFDCAFGGNLPVGAGLSSSAAVEGGLIMALNSIFKLGISRVDLAKLAQKAEHGYPGVKCGIMDQFANLNGKKDHVILLDCVSLEYKYFPLQLNEYSIYLINTNVHHSLANGEYNKRREECEEGFFILKEHIGGDINSWRQITSEQVIAYKYLLNDSVFNRCLFVTQEIFRTLKAGELLKQNNLIEFGELMFQTHEGLSTLYNVSCPELDFLVDKVRLLPEVIGSRVMGGGFGGCTINIIKKEKADSVLSSIISMYHKNFNKVPEIYEVATSNGTFEII